jgi:Concanavalin A-like lectin/glucanases superfamily
LGGNTGTTNSGTDLTFSGLLGSVRIHSGVLTPQQIMDAYNFEKSTYQPVGGPPSSPLFRAPLHRYSFTGTPSATIAPGAVVPDSIGTANGNVRGTGAVFTSDGLKLQLPGGASSAAPYIDLPNGLISPLTNVTLEAWVQQNGDQNWSRIVDFGTADVGEILDVGGTSTGTNYIMLSANTGNNPNQRLEHIGGFSPNPGGGTTRDSQRSRILNTELHIAVTYEAAIGEWKWYQNGALMESVPDASGLSSIPDVNNWLGRSQWSGDANFQGFYDEFRIYDYALTQAQVVGNFNAGPDVVAVVPEPVSTALVGLGTLSLLGLRRKRRR